MSVPATSSANQVSCLNITISETGISEFSDGKRIIFVPREQIRRIELEFGSRAERPLVQGIFGLLLSSFVLVGLSLFVTGSLVGLRWGLGLVFFGAMGVFCLYEVLQKGHYLRVVSANDKRKLVFKGRIKKSELSEFIKGGAGLGYPIQNQGDLRAIE